MLFKSGGANGKDPKGIHLMRANSQSFVGCKDIAIGSGPERVRVTDVSVLFFDARGRCRKLHS
jgi:hypothetical protein